MTVEEVARVCKVHPMTVRRHIAQGRLRATRVGRSVRVRQEDFGEYLGRPAESGIPAGKTGILKDDDPFWELEGIIDDPAAADLSENKHKYLADAYTPKP